MLGAVVRRVAIYVAAVVFACIAIGVTVSIVWDHHGQRGCPSGHTLDAAICRQGG